MLDNYDPATDEVGGPIALSGDPVRARFSLEQLRERVFTHPVEPDWIPYRTSYYNENWAFCLSRRQLDALELEGEVGAA